MIETPRVLTREERNFVLEGVRHGPYSERSSATDEPVVTIAMGRKIYIDDQLIHHGSLWTTKSLESRHKEHIANCIRDSQAWREGGHCADTSVVACVARVVERFGDENMYVRKHSGCRSVKVFRGADTMSRHCSLCEHCDAYEFLNGLLGCAAQHGPYRGWDTPGGGSAGQGLAVGRGGHGTVPSERTRVGEDVQESTRIEEAGAQARAEAAAMGQPREMPSEVPAEDRDTSAGDIRTARFSVSVLRLNHHNSVLREALLASDLAQEMRTRGVNVEPAWARGAKVLMEICASALPEGIELRPYHVLVACGDEGRVEEALADIPYKQRPRVREQTQQALSFIVEKTFVYVAEPRALTPRSAVTVSSNDGRRGHTNPRTFAWQGCLWTSTAEGSAAEMPPRSFEEHVADMKECQVRCDLPLALQSYSSMLRDDLQPDQQVFTIIIDICGKTGACTEAERWFDRMASGFGPTAITFNCLIHAWARAKNHTRAEEWFERMVSAGVEPSLVTFNCLISACARRGNVDRAVEWQAKAERDFRFRLSKHSFSPIIQYFARKGLPEEAESWFDIMVSRGIAHDQQIFGMLTTAAANARDLTATVAYGEKAVAAGYALEVFDYTQRLRACMPSLEHSLGRERSEHADAIFREQLRADVKPDYFNIKALDAALGSERSRTLCEELGVDVELAQREHDAVRQELGVKGWMTGRVNSGGFFNRSDFFEDGKEADEHGPPS